MKNNKFILGVETLDYVSKKTNKRVNGVIVHVGENIDNGVKPVASVFVADGREHEYPTNYPCEVYFNHYGRACKIVVEEF